MNDDNKYCDRQYVSIVQDILENEEFTKTKEIVHHGLDRMGHSLRVSYYSYKLSKLFGLDYESAARAGLLHDFFFENNSKSNVKQRAETLVNHPKYALKNAIEHFNLNDKEKDIIVSHMFPVAPKPPKYVEGWIVNVVDDVVAIAEVSYKARTKLSYAFNFLLILMFTYLR